MCPHSPDALHRARSPWAAACLVALLLAACGPMRLVDDASYLGRSYDSREPSVVRLRFIEASGQVILTAELPNGEQCTAKFLFDRETRPLHILPPRSRDYVGTWDATLPEPCATWVALSADPMVLRITYHPLTDRYRVGLRRSADARRIAGDWFVVRTDVPKS